MNYFKYGKAAILHLQNKDKKLGRAIAVIGPLKRKVHTDLFSALINSIVGQQISSKAQITIWQRIMNDLGEVTPAKVANCSIEDLQRYGMSFRKAAYIHNAAQHVLDKRLDINALQQLDDKRVCEELVKLDGVGIWTAEMLMLFAMGRQDVLSFGDLAIVRGMRMLYRHKQITRPLFEKYRRRYSPYGSVASLYLWAIAGGALAGLSDTVKVKSKTKNP